MKQAISLNILFFACIVTAFANWQADYAQLLKTYAHPDGVDYAAWHKNKEDLKALDKVAQAIGQTDSSGFSRSEKIALYTNAYNAWMLKLVLDAYPVSSVTEIKPDWGVFSLPLAKMEGKAVSLDHIEKTVLLKELKEPRVHFAVNCASISCPPLSSEVFTAEKLEQQLEAATAAFINSDHGVLVKGGKPHISKLFEWYVNDFQSAKGSVLDYINHYRAGKLKKGTKLRYQEYDWGLNATLAK